MCVCSPALLPQLQQALECLDESGGGSQDKGWRPGGRTWPNSLGGSASKVAFGAEDVRGGAINCPRATVHSHSLLAACARCLRRVGYRHIDCAAEYKNEGEVGAALREVLQAGLVQRQGACARPQAAGWGGWRGLGRSTLLLMEENLLFGLVLDCPCHTGRG